MERHTYEMAMLFDFYGDLLTERQKEFFDLYYNEDLSLAEIAEHSGISRQGVRDVLVRAEAILTEFEAKTGTIARFQTLQQLAEEIQSAAGQIVAVNRLYRDKRIDQLANQICQTAIRMKE